MLDRVRAKQPGIDFDTEFFVTLPPAQDSSTSVIADHMREAHRAVMGAPPEEGVGMFLSDAGHLQAYNIPCANYGPSGRTVTGKENWDPDVGEHLNIDDLTHTARVYATLILDVLSKTRQELGLKVLPV